MTITQKTQTKLLMKYNSRIFGIMKKYFLFCLLPCLALVIIGCNNKEDKVIEEVVPPKEIKRIKIYIENSASNQGYFDGATQFKTMMGDLVRIAENNIADSIEIDIYFIAKDIQKFDGNGFEFIKYMSTDKVAKGEGYPLGEMFSEIQKNYKTGEVILFVSDCILSHSDSEIRNNKEINKEAASSALKAGIAYVFEEFKEKGVSSSIYAFSSEFNGEYFNYKNEGKGKKISEVRPYYLWVIAEPENMNKVQSALKENSSFKPEQELHFGTSREPIESFVFYPGLLSKGEWMPNISENRIYDLKSDKKDPGINFTIGLNLSSLPLYMQDLNYLNKNVIVNSEEFDVDFEFLKKNPEFETILKNKAAEDYRSNSHILSIKLKESSIKQGKVEIQLPLNYDEWYKKWSCDSDLTPAERQGKTFAFTHLIEGVKSAYSPKNQNIINITINIGN
jgi:hypothetical protein